MGSPLGPSLANVFLSYYEKNWLNNCPQGFKPVFYRRYVDDIFLLFKSNDHLKYFQDFLNSCHSNMSFSMETEKESQSKMVLPVTKKLSLSVHVLVESWFFMKFYNFSECILLIFKKAFTQLEKMMELIIKLRCCNINFNSLT